MFQVKKLFNIAVEVTETVDFLHYEFKLHAGDELRVTLDHQADVRLVDDANYALFKAKAKYEFVGGHAIKMSRYRFSRQFAKLLSAATTQTFLG